MIAGACDVQSCCRLEPDVAAGRDGCFAAVAAGDRRCPTSRSRSPCGRSARLRRVGPSDRVRGNPGHHASRARSRNARDHLNRTGPQASGRGGVDCQRQGLRMPDSCGEGPRPRGRQWPRRAACQYSTGASMQDAGAWAARSRGQSPVGPLRRGSRAGEACSPLSRSARRSIAARRPYRTPLRPRPESAATVGSERGHLPFAFDRA